MHPVGGDTRHEMVFPEFLLGVEVESTHHHAIGFGAEESAGAEWLGEDVVTGWCLSREVIVQAAGVIVSHVDR